MSMPQGIKVGNMYWSSQMWFIVALRLISIHT